ncbi:hypothetical protein B0J12DRAFT_258212 [Macrophomina phaseolina]|uniref:Uncharacterized protein n=1 Tax=Macrophomina phaseolina TaxID=35725 RepID=A0ABQ8FZI3_9PEZI|nr:hypothetical protein B0J12DRAFT_258212 [Macrophomina phaseolina]
MLRPDTQLQGLCRTEKTDGIKGSLRDVYQAQHHRREYRGHARHTLQLRRQLNNGGGGQNLHPLLFFSSSAATIFDAHGLFIILIRFSMHGNQETESFFLVLLLCSVLAVYHSTAGRSSLATEMQG